MTEEKDDDPAAVLAAANNKKGEPADAVLVHDDDDDDDAKTQKSQSCHEHRSSNCFGCHCTRRWILLLFSFLATSAVAGVVYGWPALRRQLLSEGSTLTEAQLGAVFTVGAWSTQGGRFAVGWARDRTGTRRVGAVSLVAVAAGAVGMALADASDAVSLGVALFLLGGGAGVQLLTQPVAGLFPRHGGAVASTLSGAFQISGSAFWVLLAPPWDRRSAFLAYAALALALLGLEWRLFPAGPSFVVLAEDDADDDDGSDKEKEDTTNANHIIEDGSSSRRNVMNGDDEHNEESTDSVATEKNSSNTPTLLEQLLSVEYLLLLVWFCVLLPPLQYYIATLGFQLEARGDDDGRYAAIFAAVYGAAAAVAPAGGWVSDRGGLGLAQGLATACSAASLFWLGAERLPLDAHIAGMALYSVGRMFVFGMYFSNIGKRFGYTNFGTLSGAGLLISAIVSLLQYPLIAAASNGNATAVNWGCGVALLSLTPYCVWLAIVERKSPMARPWRRQKTLQVSDDSVAVEGGSCDNISVSCRSNVLLAGDFPSSGGVELRDENSSSTFSSDKHSSTSRTDDPC